MSHYNFMANFPDSVSIDKIGIKHQGSGEVTIKVSSDSLDGIDGTWITYSIGSINNNEYTELSAPVTEAKWLRVLVNHIEFGSDNCYALWLFGEYQNPRFEIWDETETNKLNTVNYPMSDSFITAYNDTDFNETASFKIKNLSGSAKAYTVSIGAIRYDGDTFISTYGRVAEDDGVLDWNTSITTASVPYEGFSNPINIKYEFLKANNPADGYRYFTINVPENE